MKIPDRDSLDFATETSTTSSPEIPEEMAHVTVPGLVILSHPDPGRVGEESTLGELGAGQPVALSRRHPQFLPHGRDVSPRALADSRLSRRPWQLTTGPGPGDIRLERRGSPTQVAVGGEAVERDVTFSAADVERGVALTLSGHVALLLKRIPALPAPPEPDLGLVGQSPAMVRLRREIRAAATLDVPVLVRGETGTGKELVSRAIHDAGVHRRGPYLAVNLGALVPALAASELFGATRGAYTGADRGRQGYFRRADGGTLFLDEIGEAPLEVQVMLLRTLETGRVQAVGSVEEKAVAVRIIAATDAELEAAIEAGRFRPALLHRLAGYEIRVPPLRERRDDIARLLKHFLRLETDALTGRDAELPWPRAAVVSRLVDHDWPGNVRELRNVARRLAVLRLVEGVTDASPLLDHLLKAPTQPPAPRAADLTPAPTRLPDERRRGADVGGEELLQALEANEWRPGPTAAALGVSRPTLYRLIDSHPELRKASDLGRGELQQAFEQYGSLEAVARAIKVSPQGLRRRLTALGFDF